MYSYSNDEEAVQSCLSELRLVLRSNIGNLNFVEGPDPVFNEAVHRIKQEVLGDLLLTTEDSASLEAIQKAIKIVQSKRLE